MGISSPSIFHYVSDLKIHTPLNYKTLVIYLLIHCPYLDGTHFNCFLTSLKGFIAICFTIIRKASVIFNYLKGSKFTRKNIIKRFHRNRNYPNDIAGNMLSAPIYFTEKYREIKGRKISDGTRQEGVQSYVDSRYCKIR